LKQPLIMPKAEPFFFPGGPVGCILVHGFTASPQEMRGLGEYLAGQGYSVMGVRLAGHSTEVQDLPRMRWWDWLASVSDAYNLLRNLTDQIFVIGLSLGGILSLTFAARYPVDGVVAMAAPHHLPNDPRLHFVRLIALLHPYHPKGTPMWFDQDALKQRVAYNADPLICFVQIQQLLAEMRSGLPEISAPALLIYSKNDPAVTVQEGHMDAIYAELGSQQKERLWVEKSGHILTCDQERPVVWQAIANFLTQHSGVES
jgi:carboxylesterase